MQLAATEVWGYGQELSIHDLPRECQFFVQNLPRRPKKLSEEAKTFIDQQMQKNDEVTSSQIQKKLEKCGIFVCSATVRITRKKLGWTLQKTAYCQLIRAPNKTKRLEYAQRVLESGDTFYNVIFSDECSVSLQLYCRTCYRNFHTEI